MIVNPPRLRNGWLLALDGREGLRLSGSLRTVRARFPHTAKRLPAHFAPPFWYLFWTVPAVGKSSDNTSRVAGSRCTRLRLYCTTVTYQDKVPHVLCAKGRPRFGTENMVPFTGVPNIQNARAQLTPPLPIKQKDEGNADPGPRRRQRSKSIARACQRILL